MATGSTTIRGWDAPLDVDWDFQLQVLRREIQMCAPSKGGALAQAFDSPDTAVLSEDRGVITISVGTQHKAWRYAKIQNFGGYVPPFNIRTQGRPGHKPVMRAMIGGAYRFFTKRRGFHIQGADYVKRGVFNWWSKLCRGATMGGKQVVQWRSKHYAQGLR